MKFPRHISLSLTHNENAVYYETVRDEVEKRGPDDDLYTWASDEQRRLALERNDWWVLQWYPDTPVGFFCVAGHDLEAVLAKANEIGAEDT